jgi:hypothetical protein
MNLMDKDLSSEIEQKVSKLVNLIQRLKNNKIRYRLYRNFLYVLSTFELVLFKMNNNKKKGV